MRRTGRRRDLIITGIVFVALTVAGEFWVIRTDFHPMPASREAGIVDGAFDLLMVLSVPVFAFVIAVLGYALARFRVSHGDADPVRHDPRFMWGWLVVSAGLAIFSIFNPGFKGLEELRAEPNADLVIGVTAEQWNWSFSFEEEGLTLEDPGELVLPVDTRIAFEVTSVDVIHSFWIPAFRIKVDAIPGQVETVLTTPTVTGEYEANPMFRVQCAEMCGTGHARMSTAVRVVDQDEFDAWLTGMRADA